MVLCIYLTEKRMFNLRGIPLEATFSENDGHIFFN